MTDIPDQQNRLAYSVSEAVAATGIGRTTLYGLINSGQLASHTIGRRRIIPADALLELVKGESKCLDYQSMQ